MLSKETCVKIIGFYEARKLDVLSILSNPDIQHLIDNRTANGGYGWSVRDEHIPSENERRNIAIERFTFLIELYIDEGETNEDIIEIFRDGMY